MVQAKQSYENRHVCKKALQWGGEATICKVYVGLSTNNMLLASANNKLYLSVQMAVEIPMAAISCVCALQPFMGAVFAGP